MDRVYLGVIEAYRYKRVFYSGVDDDTACHCDECSTHVCVNNASGKVFSFLNDYCIWSRLLTIWLRGVSKAFYWLVGI